MKMIFAHLKIPVEQMREIVTLMMNVKVAFFVDQIIVQLPSAFILNLIAVMSQLLTPPVAYKVLVKQSYIPTQAVVHTTKVITMPLLWRVERKRGEKVKYYV